ncbi:hypothetical protein KKA47_05750 [bacterium]|nr:hypothetical protein [bacterium]
MKKVISIFVAVIAIFGSFNLFAVDCAKYQKNLEDQYNPIKDLSIYQIQGVIANYECFSKDGLFEIEFSESKINIFKQGDSPLTIQLNSPADKLTIKNLNIQVQDGVQVDKVINITPDPEIIYTADAKITLENSVINGNGTVESKAINVTASNVTIFDNTISSFDYGIYLEPAAQGVKLTQNEFQGTFTEPIHLEPGANGDIQPIDTVSEGAKLWKVMNDEETEVAKVV